MNYLHLGRGYVVSDADIVGIFDLDITSQSHLTRKFLAACAEFRLPVLAGTEMNAPGQLLADDFSVPALACHYGQLAAGADAFTR